MSVKDKFIFVSVVRDFDMYDRIVRNNPFNEGADFVFFDNRTSNVGVAERYNSFLDAYDYSEDAWFVFCHEDWEVREDLRPKLRRRSRKSLYGPIGMSTYVSGGKLFSFPMGYCRQTYRDGSGETECRGFLRSGIVDTFDCQCLMVHSSLVRKYSLRFDVRFTFDLYVEDFCISAYERYGVLSRILPIDCRHWSYGNISERFYRLKDYLSSKCGAGVYGTVVGASYIGDSELISGCSVVSFRKFFMNHPEKYWLLLKYRRERKRRKFFVGAPEA